MSGMPYGGQSAGRRVRSDLLRWRITVLTVLLKRADCRLNSRQSPWPQVRVQTVSDRPSATPKRDVLRVQVFTWGAEMQPKSMALQSRNAYAVGGARADAQTRWFI